MKPAKWERAAIKRFSRNQELARAYLEYLLKTANKPSVYQQKLIRILKGVLKNEEIQA